MNIGPTKTGPKDFEILRVLGKGGYGKVSILKVFCNYSLQLVFFLNLLVNVKNYLETSEFYSDK